jgi:hypothetical protein
MSLVKLIFIIAVIVVAGLLAAPDLRNQAYEIAKKDNEIAIQKQINEQIKMKVALLESLMALDINDKGLFECIKKEIDDYIKDIFLGGGITDVTILKRLKCENKKIKSIKGIENFKLLTYLDLSRNLISDLTPLLKLSNLNNLYLKGNEMIDMDTLLKFGPSIKINLPDFHSVDCPTLVNFIKKSKFKMSKNSFRKYNKRCKF